MRAIVALIKATAAFLVFIFTLHPDLRAQDSARHKEMSKEVVIKNLVESRDFVFIPGYVTPSKGARRIVNASYYFLDLKKDTLTCYLPYFGRTYSPPLTSADIMFDFTSTDFEYSSVINKKGGWEITIKLKDQTDVRELYLTVFNNGIASLNLTSINRDPIYFEGNINKPDKKK